MKQLPFQLTYMPPTAAEAVSCPAETARLALIEEVEKGNITEAESLFESTVLPKPEAAETLVHASYFQIGAWIAVALQQYEKAGERIVGSLQLLAACNNKKNTEVTAMTAALLYDYAVLCHNNRRKTKAEKALGKASAIYNRLQKSQSERFVEAAAYTAAATTEIYRSKIKMLNTLAHHQAATEYYTDAVKSGAAEAMNSLINSISKEAETMFEMEHYRTAVRLYTKAVRYQQKLSPKFGIKELRLSLQLAEALLYLPMRKETGIRLLETLQASAQKMKAEKELEKINAYLNGQLKAESSITAFFKNLIS